MPDRIDMKDFLLSSKENFTQLIRNKSSEEIIRILARTLYLSVRNFDINLPAKILSATPKHLLQRVMNSQIDWRDGLKFSVALSIFTKGSKEILELFLKKEFDVNRELSNGKRPLEIAVEKNYYSLAQLLLKNGADSNISNILITAASEQNHEIAKLLLEKGADVNSENEKGYTALWFFARDGQFELVKLLLDRGADVNKDPFSKQGFPPLSVLGIADMNSDRGPKRYNKTIDLLKARADYRKEKDPEVRKLIICYQFSKKLGKKMKKIKYFSNSYCTGCGYKVRPAGKGSFICTK